MTTRRWAACVATVLAVVGIAACQAEPSDQTGPATTTPATTQPAASSPGDPADPAMCTVPDVVGMVHQTAQDTMQAAGLLVLREKDATGQGRALLYDRNWTTTAQSVPAGTVVDCTIEILLSAKKTSE